MFRLLFSVLLFFVSVAAKAAPMLPKPYCGAQGFGKTTVSWSEQTNFKVCRWNSDANTGGSPTLLGGRVYQGTLQQCLNGLTDPRIIVPIGARNMALTSPIAVTNSNDDFAIMGQAAPVQITCPGLDYDTAGFSGRCFTFYRWTSKGDFSMQFIRWRELRNTGTAFNSSNYSQSGGNITIEDVDGGTFWHNTFSHANDDSVASYGASTGKRYNQNITFQDSLFTSALNYKVFPKHLIVFPTSGATYPTGSDTCGHTVFRSAFVGHARTPEYKCKELEYINNIVLGETNSVAYSPVRLIGDNVPDVRYNLFMGMTSAQQNRPVDSEYNYSGPPPTYDGFHITGVVDYLYEGNWKEDGSQWSGHEVSNFKDNSSLVLPRPTARPVRTPLGDTDNSEVITSSAIALRDSILPEVGASYYYSCDGTKVPYRDKLDKLAVKELYEGRTYQRQTEAQDGGAQTMVYGTTCADTDNDGMFDAYETRFGFSNSTDDALGDADGDGYENIFEYFFGMDPTVSDAGDC